MNGATVKLDWIGCEGNVIKESKYDVQSIEIKYCGQRIKYEFCEGRIRVTDQNYGGEMTDIKFEKLIKWLNKATGGKIQEIRYFVDNKHCITPCPYGKKSKNTGNIYKVGSPRCEVCRPYYRGIDTDRQVVFCSHPELEKPEQSTYTVPCVCDNCGHEQDSPETEKGTPITNGTLYICSNCGWASLWRK